MLCLQLFSLNKKKTHIFKRQSYFLTMFFAHVSQGCQCVLQVVNILLYKQKFLMVNLSPESSILPVETSHTWMEPLCRPAASSSSRSRLCSCAESPRVDVQGPNSSAHTRNLQFNIFSLLQPDSALLQTQRRSTEVFNSSR